MEVRETKKDRKPRSEPEEQEDEDQAFDEAYVAEVFEKYRPVSFG